MPVIQAEMRRASWGGPNPGGFTPNPTSKIVWSGPRHAFDIHRNPVVATKGKTKKTAAVRFFIGFAVGGVERWTMDDLIRIVREIRDEQMEHPDATFVAQTGVYSYKEAGKHSDTVVTENGAQLIIVNMNEWGVRKKKFYKQMQELGEELCHRLEQELIFAEWQINGLIKETWRVTP